MQRLQFVLFQMDEAKRYLASGPLPSLRVALMLLDNAAEVILDRWIEDDLAHDDFSERIRSRAREVGIPETHPQFVDVYQRHFLTGKEKKKISRFFDEKIRYLTETKPTVPLQTGSVLSHLHRYRNDAHHSARVRQETVRTFGMIFLELCCQLIESLGQVSAGYSSSEDFSWLVSRFELKPIDLCHEGAIPTVLAEFRNDLPIGENSIRETLGTNLESRLEDLSEGLEYISTETHVAIDRAAALAESQRFTLAETKKSAPYRRTPPKLNEPVSLSQLDWIESIPGCIRNSSDALAGFRIYAEADAELERIEFMVQGFVGAIDAAIQMAVDRARGK
ncbi:MAG: hypothetical protein WBN82_03735 [Porticoccaceae bacterium]